MLVSIRNKYRHLPKQVKASLWFLICAFFEKSISNNRNAHFYQNNVYFRVWSI
ncbi:polysaccharide biosynthesis protein [Lactiplantibacillus plantarum]|nr:polysaccharide biosynthesis protein [Lactiplantibacillus plantarum]